MAEDHGFVSHEGCVDFSESVLPAGDIGSTAQNIGIPGYK